MSGPRLYREKPINFPTKKIRMTLPRISHRKPRLRAPISQNELARNKVRATSRREAPAEPLRLTSVIPSLILTAEINTHKNQSGSPVRISTLRGPFPKSTVFSVRPAIGTMKYHNWKSAASARQNRLSRTCHLDATAHVQRKTPGENPSRSHGTRI